MTWGEVLELAKRFPTEDGVTGLYMQNFNYLQQEIALAEGLSLINITEKKVTVNTESYKKIFEMMLDAYESKALVLPNLDGSEVYDPFIMGESAMTVDYYYLNNKIYWAKEEKGDEFQLNWDLASAPAGENSREVSPYFYFGGIFTVSAESPSKQAAWELVKHANSDQLARSKSRTASFTAPTRTQYLYNPDGKKIESFYNQKPKLDNIIRDYALVPDGFYGQMGGIINSEAKTIMIGTKTLDEAMISMQERGQQWLDRNGEK